MSIVKIAISGFLSLAVVGCTQERDFQALDKFQNKAASVQTDQIMYQLALSFDNPYRIPTLMFVGDTTLQQNSAVSATLNRSLATTGDSKSLALTLGALSDQSVMTVHSTSAPLALEALRDVFAYAVSGDDTMMTDEVRKGIDYPEPKYPWIYKSLTAAPPSGCLTCKDLGIYGKYHLFVRSSKDLSNFEVVALRAAALVAPDQQPTPVPAGKKGDLKAKPTGKAPATQKRELAPSNLLITQ